MTYDEFLNNEKARGRIIYRCRKCEFRGMGASVFYHEMHNHGHQCVNEDTLKETKNN